MTGNLDAAMISAWQQASADLGFRLQAPFQLKSATDDAVWVEGYLPDFGGPSGMIFTALDRGSIQTDLYRSSISATYRTYDRKAFVEALRDWGWFGSAARRPIWLDSDGS